MLIRNYSARQRIGVGVLALVLGSAAPVFSLAPIPIPPLARTEEGTYRTRDLRTGSELWQASWVLRSVGSDGQPEFQLQETGVGQREHFAGSHWTVEMRIALWQADSHVTALREGRDTGGQPLEVEQRDFDYATGKGVIRTTDLRTGGTATKEIPLSTRPIPPELLPAVLRLLPDTPDRRLRFDLATQEGHVVGMEARIVGTERVAVPAGEFDCYKIELTPTGLVGVLARVVLPRLYMWHTLAPPHFWVKYEGLEAGPGSRRIVRELVAFHAG
jgi:hypothetical protein